MKSLTLSKDLEVPASFASRTVAVLGQKGSGKTYTAGVIAEEMLEVGLHVVIMDPLGVWWGLQSDASGGAGGYPILILGGEHANVPLDPGGGELVAEFVVKSGQSCILDMSHFASDAEQDRFVTAFLARLFRLKISEKSNLHIIMDEADSFLPQNPLPGQQLMLHAGTAIVRRGRSRGLGMTMITQRPAVINKSPLEMSDAVICHRFVGKNDRKAIIDTVQQRASEEEMEAFQKDLAVLEDGETFFWSPQYLKLFKRVKIRHKRTFDSSKTPDPGEIVRKPKAAAKVDVDKLTTEMKAAAEQAKSNDPRELRRRIQELEKQLKAAPAKSIETVKEKRVEVPIFKEGHVKRLEAAAAKLVLAGMAAGTLGKEITDLLAKVQTGNKTPNFIPNSITPRHAPPAKLASTIPNRIPNPITRASSSSSDHLPEGERKVLTVIAQYPEGAEREQITVLTGYKRSSRDTYIQRLRGRGFVEVRGEQLVPTASGVEALGSDFEPLPTGEQLQQYWMQRLPEGERKILQVLVQHHPEIVGRDFLSEETGYLRSSRDTYIQRLRSRQLVTTDAAGVRASDNLF